jgi:hypothetical protein
MSTAVSVPLHSLEALLDVPSLAALRIFLIICTVLQGGAARITVRELSARSRMSERTVFDVLSQLEETGCIYRALRSPGPQVNEIRLTEDPHLSRDHIDTDLSASAGNSAMMHCDGEVPLGPESEGQSILQPAAASDSDMNAGAAENDRNEAPTVGVDAHPAELEQQCTATQDDPPCIQQSIASCYRSLDATELHLAEGFVAEQFGGDVARFTAVAEAVRVAGGVSPEMPLQFCLMAIRVVVA